MASDEIARIDDDSWGGMVAVTVAMVAAVVGVCGMALAVVALAT